MKTIAVTFLLMLAISAIHSQDYGWQVIARPMLNRPLEAVDFVDVLHGWCGGRDSIFRTTDGGFTWLAVDQSDFLHIRSISFSDTLHGWAAGIYAGPDGMILRTTDGGRTWRQQLHSYPCRFEGTAALSTQRNVTVGWTTVAPDTAKIFRTTNGGSTWMEQVFDANTGFTTVVSVDSLHGFVASGSRYILKTSDGGVSWQRMSKTTTYSAITFLDTLHGWGADGGAFYRTRDGGVNWDSVFAVPNPGHDFNAEKLSFVDTANGWAFGSAVDQGIITEAIFATTDGGTTWHRESIGLTDDLGILHDGKMIDRHHGWAVAYDGRVLSYQRASNVVEKLRDTPQGFKLEQNYPNPFNPSTTIEYELPRQAHVRLTIHDALGEDVATLIDIVQQSGVYRIEFYGGDLASGTYYYTLKTEWSERTLQMLYVK